MNQLEHGIKTFDNQKEKGEIQMWVYIESERGLYTVGFYDHNGGWHPESDHNSKEEAAKRVHYLNGGNPEVIDK